MFSFFFFPWSPHISVWMWWQDGGLGWKGCSDHGSVESHPWCEAIIASSLSSCPLHYLNPTSQPITPPSCLSPPFHYSHLTSHKIRVTLGSPPSPTFSFSPSPPSLFLFLTHYSQFTGWYMKGDTGPIQSLVPISHSACLSATASRLWAYFSSRSSLCFLHFTPPLLSFATQNFPFPHLSLMFSIYLSFFFSLPLIFFKDPCDSGKMSWRRFCCISLLIYFIVPHLSLKERNFCKLPLHNIIAVHIIPHVAYFTEA